jgi:hypothetical protein
VWSWSLPKNSIKGRKKIRLLRRFFYSAVKKNYLFSIKMSTRIKRLSFAMLYRKGKAKNEEYRKLSAGLTLFERASPNSHTV